MIQINSLDRQITQLADAAGKAGKRFNREMATVINQVGRKTKTSISKSIRQELAAPAKAVNQTIVIGSKAELNKLQTSVTVKASRRLPLKQFGARQTKRGVSYRISKTGGRQTLPGAFVVNKFGDNVFKRTTDARLPIVKLFGVSPWGVFVKRKLVQPTRKEVRLEMIKQIKRRTKFLNLKASGAI